MKKLLILLVFIVVSVCLAGVDVLLVNYVFSPEGEQLMERLTEYVQDGDWTELTNREQPGDICLFVKEYWIPKGIDPHLEELYRHLRRGGAALWRLCRIRAHQQSCERYLVCGHGGFHPGFQ